MNESSQTIFSVSGQKTESDSTISSIRSIIDLHDKRLYALEVHLEHTGSKEEIANLRADLSKAFNNHIWQIVAIMMAILAVVISIFAWLAPREGATNTEPQIIVIQAQPASPKSEEV